MSAGCLDRFTCEECGRRHHTLLHGVKLKSSNPQPDTKAKLSVLQPKKKEPQREARSESKPAPESSHSNAISAAHSSVPGNESLITNCRIVLVDLFHKANPEKQIKVYALPDDASDTTFVTTQVKEKLGIEGVQTSLNLSTMLGREVLEDLTDVSKLSYLKRTPEKTFHPDEIKSRHRKLRMSSRTFRK